MIFFSVIIPNYNHAQFLERRIQSVINQTYRNFELIILDDASHDESKEIIEKYRQHPQITKTIINDSNSGSAFKQWKKGIEHSAGHWIWIAESDDEASPEFLETANLALMKYPSAGIFYCNSTYENSEFKTTGERNNTLFATTRWSDDYFIRGNEEIKCFLSKYNTIVNASSAIMHKNSLMPILDKYNSVDYMGDWLSYLQIASKKDIVYSSKLLNIYRRHGNSVFNKKIPVWKTKREYFVIYNFLRKLPFQNNKSTERFYVVNYLDFGWKSDGLADNLKTIKSYLENNLSLAIRVLLKIFLKKLGLFN